MFNLLLSNLDASRFLLQKHNFVITLINKRKIHFDRVCKSCFTTVDLLSSGWKLTK